MMQTLWDSSDVKEGWSVKASKLSSGETTESEEITGTEWTKKIGSYPQSENSGK